MSNPNMRIIVDPGTFDCLNMGDVAMLKVAVRRLGILLPSAAIGVLTSSPNRLLDHVETGLPVNHHGRLVWFSDSALTGGLKERIPGLLSGLLSEFNRSLRHHKPELLSALLHWKSRIGGADGRAAVSFLQEMQKADLYVVSGAITLTDKSKGHGRMVLDSLEMAINRGIPAVMFSQGLGPLYDPNLIARARAVLPRVDLITVRERRNATRLLASLGVDPARVLVTGDDAVELAHEMRPLGRGQAIGVNLRVGPSSDVSASVVETLRPVACSEKKQARGE